VDRHTFRPALNLATGSSAWTSWRGRWTLDQNPGKLKTMVVVT
jgi:hypothetical protein